MDKEAGMNLVRAAITAGVMNDLGSGRSQHLYFSCPAACMFILSCFPTAMSILQLSQLEVWNAFATSTKPNPSTKVKAHLFTPREQQVTSALNQCCSK